MSSSAMSAVNKNSIVFHFQISQGHHVTMEEFYKNSFVVVFIMFLASFVSSHCSENYNYIVVSESINVRTAIQVNVLLDLLNINSKYT